MPTYQHDIVGVHYLLERDGGDWSHGRRKLLLLLALLEGGRTRSKQIVIMKWPGRIARRRRDEQQARQDN